MGDGVAGITKNRAFFVRMMENKIVTDFGISVFQAFAFFSTQATCFISKTTFKSYGLP
jgi:hypothetical protein